MCLRGGMVDLGEISVGNVKGQKPIVEKHKAGSEGPSSRMAVDQNMWGQYNCHRY